MLDPITSHSNAGRWTFRYVYSSSLLSIKFWHLDPEENNFHFHLNTANVIIERVLSYLVCKMLPSRDNVPSSCRQPDQRDLDY